MLMVVALFGGVLLGCTGGDDEEEATNVPPPAPNIDFTGGDPSDPFNRGPRAGTLTSNTIATLQAQTRVAATLEVVTETPTPTATINPEFIVTFTPMPTVVVDDENDFIGNSYTQQEWLQYNFTLTDGSGFTLEDFVGNVIVISVIQPQCGECVEQIRTVREGAEVFEEQLGNAGIDAIFLALNVSTTTSIESLGFVAERDGYAASEELSWLTGLASQPLRSALESTFGEDIFAATNLPVIFLDQNGIAHLTNADLIDRFFIRDALIVYNGGSLQAGDE